VNIYVAGIGAVSPAGWGVAAMEKAVEQQSGPVTEEHVSPGSKYKLRMRNVPAPIPRPAFFSHPRLRRASPLSQYLAGAATEAIGTRTTLLNERRLTIVSCLQSGPVQYACRFYGEVLKDPAQASPLLFPETVFSAPASHIAVLVESSRRDDRETHALAGPTPCATTFLGDPGTFLQGVAWAAGWLLEGKTDLCLILGAEEFNWIVASASWHLDRHSILGAGAGAVLLACDPELSIGARLDCITDSHTYSENLPPVAAVAAMKAQLPPGNAQELLVDGLGGARRIDIAEEKAWKDWPGHRISPKKILGEGLMAGSAWQFVLAANAVAKRAYPAATVSVAGCNQQAIWARLVADRR